MNNEKEKFEWWDLLEEDLLGSYSSFDELQKDIEESGHIQPNFGKMHRELQEKNEFTYCTGVYQVKKVL